MITVAELKGLAANKSLSIGEAWNALDAAAQRIEDMENWLRPVVERMRLEAHVHRNRDAFHAETLEAFAKDVEASFANARREFPAASAGKLDGVVGSLESET